MMSRKRGRDKGEKDAEDGSGDSREGSPASSIESGPLRAGNASSSSAASQSSDDSDAASQQPHDRDQKTADGPAAKSSFGASALQLLSLLKPEETVNGLLRRIAGDEAAMAAVSESVRLLLADHDVNVMQLSREALLMRTVRESLRQQGPSLPSMWFIRWEKDVKRTVHGPFTSEAMEGWRIQKVFTAKAAAVLDGASVGARWTAATAIESFSSPSA